MAEEIKYISLRPWAKINLYLKILGRRNDGYHQILTLIHPIALFDELTIRCAKDGLVLKCRQDGLPEGQNIPNPEDNLVYKAGILFFNRIGQTPSVEIDLVKRIPIGGGLGGGSSDAASTLIGLNRLFGEPLDNSALYKISLELGMDVPFFLEPKPALCSGRGEVIEKRYQNIDFWCILVNPGEGLSTRSVYENLDLTSKGSSGNIFHFSDIKKIDKVIGYNDLEDSAIKLCPEIGTIKRLLQKAGVWKSFICGSGSTVCGLVSNKEQAEEVMERVKEEAFGDWWIRTVCSYGW